MTNTRKWGRLVPELSVSDFDQSLTFYTAILGFSVWFERGQKPKRFVYLDREGAQIMLEEVHDGIWQTGEFVKPYGRGVNLQMECSDVKILLDALAACQYPLWRGVYEAWRDVGDGVFAGSKEFLVQDPDGYLLRFTQDIGERHTNAD